MSSRYLPRGNAIARRSPSRAAASTGGPPGNGMPSSLRHLVVGLAGRVVDRGAERHHLTRHVRDEQQRRVPAGDQQRHRGRAAAGRAQAGRRRRAPPGGSPPYSGLPSASA